MAANVPSLNVTKPAQGNTDWKQAHDDRADKLQEIAAQYLYFRIAGEAVNGTMILDDWLFDVAVDITRVQMFALKGPTGSALQIDFLKNGSAQTKLATINAGSQSGDSSISSLSYDPGAPTPEKLGLKIVNVGSTIPGMEVEGRISYHVKPIV